MSSNDIQIEFDCMFIGLIYGQWGLKTVDFYLLASSNTHNAAHIHNNICFIVLHHPSDCASNISSLYLISVSLAHIIFLHRAIATRTCKTVLVKCAQLFITLVILFLFKRQTIDKPFHCCRIESCRKPIFDKVNQSLAHSLHPVYYTVYRACKFVIHCGWSL